MTRDNKTAQAENIGNDFKAKRPAIVAGEPFARLRRHRDFENLEALLGIQPDPLQIAHHDADHVVARQRAVRAGAQILVQRHSRRRHDHVLLGPQLLERRVAPALHVRFLHDDELLRIQAPLQQQPFREQNVLARVRAAVFDEDSFLGHAHGDCDSRELIGLGLLPQPARDRSQPAGENQERGPTLQKELGAAVRYDLVVTAENQDRVGVG